MAEAREFTPDENYIELPAAYAVTSKNRAGTQGEDVFIGIVDTGVNILHSAFLTTDAVPRTRIAFMWIQHGTLAAGTTSLRDRWGTEITEAQINQILDRVAAGKTVAKALQEIGVELDAAKAATLASLILDLDPVRGRSYHGTAVASIAAGTPWRRNPGAHLVGGVAPKSKLIAVSHRKTSSSLGDTFDPELAAAAHYCFTKAGTSPCVVNLSIGRNRGRRNGRSFFSRRLDALVNERPGRALVAAMGNAGEVLKHARFASPMTVKVQLPDLFHPNIDMYLSSEKNFLVEVVPPPSTVPPNQRHAIIKWDDNQDDDTGYKHIEILIGKSHPFQFVQGGEWQLKVEGDSPIVDLWVMGSGEANDDNIRIMSVDPWDRSNEDAQVPDPFKRPKSSIRHSLVPFASGKDVISVSSIYVFQGLVDFHRMTSRGQPTDVGRVMARNSKPDLAAPGFAIRAAHWRPSARLGPMGYSTCVDPKGTSFAAPFVTGAVALMLSHNPNLTAAKIREILRTQVRLPHGVMADERNFLSNRLEIVKEDLLGEGVLNIRRVLEKVSLDLGP